MNRQAAISVAKAGPFGTVSAVLIHFGAPVDEKWKKK
jgi:hypothetical protein